MITVIGAGLAGSEAAWQAARRGVRVHLYEMRPVRSTAVHRTDRFAELVCSNSLRGAALENAAGLLKEELRRLGSLIMAAADANAVPAGGALAVDREGFSAAVTRALEEHPLVTIHREEVRQIPPEGIVVIATGPLTSDALAEDIRRFTGEEYLSFYDAASPIVTVESLDMTKLYRASRYGKGEGTEYLNAPMTREEYEAFWSELVRAEVATPHNPEDRNVCFFEGCLPVEELARRGPDTLRFGPMKPVGLPDPRTGREPYAVVQLRQDNAAATLYNLVGFQTGLRWGEQQRIFRMIPGLERAEFVRFGVMHRNTFIKSPRVLLPTLQTRRRPTLFFAGQMTGVEGYVESAAGGLVAGVNAARLALGQDPVVFPPETAVGALARYITEADPENFQPMNIAFGLLPPVPGSGGKRERHRRAAEAALRALEAFLPVIEPEPAGVGQEMTVSEATTARKNET
ncbi:methylenetetrahydrofolate--tRNA-(uracil(54)-C(5))-methyltransferase (FADH(2)-oxidizing) TrmFO [Caldinitratiruptor microaerophilus]|uniref:Methylenetetrahydrofolate--tRNA-(uracil-5-)-methyltransferase TrmFO n=1 Tax=Caldinitratiruptor microaerophilus TaxID=671077 RepID=A0AA35CI32_9FIRM|nr:methylenetetrahydrofolate--tRNA-(uracil(54)-C(5))-methyltransferase (FADH(2)-oxidizing) TrmFO [Caldinitratiruptor microaerophilus]BDG59342.1 methylenetetrahydrofolate--tRNA-(uracil-5-)-methyltransferase TrmFO [Caldinitratiruptor microaerophilus]